MEFETSRTIMISAPFVSCSFSFAPICGLESPTAKNKKPIENIVSLTHALDFEYDGMSCLTRASSPNFLILFVLNFRTRACRRKNTGMSNISKRYCA